MTIAVSAASAHLTYVQIQLVTHAARLASSKAPEGFFSGTTGTGLPLLDRLRTDRVLTVPPRTAMGAADVVTAMYAHSQAPIRPRRPGLTIRVQPVSTCVPTHDFPFGISLIRRTASCVPFSPIGWGPPR